MKAVESPEIRVESQRRLTPGFVWLSTLDSPLLTLDYARPQSIGRVRAFFGNVGVLLRAYCYIRTHGPDGLKRVSENAVLNANYLLSRVKHFLPVPQGDRSSRPGETMTPFRAALSRAIVDAL